MTFHWRNSVEVLLNLINTFLILVTVARHMVMCWVNAGYTYDQLCNVVRLTQSEDILPPRDPNDTTRFFIVPKKGPKDKEFLAHKFILQFKTMNKSMNSRQIDYAVWKSLLYVMRGCDKIVNTATSTSGYKVLYNYLPPGTKDCHKTSAMRQPHICVVLPHC